MDAERRRIAVQFSLRALLGWVALLGVLLAVLPLASASALTVLGAGCYFALVPLAKTEASAVRRLGPSLLLMLALILAECGCALMAYHTMGGVFVGCYFLLILLNAWALTVFIAEPRTGLVMATVLAALIIPHQVHLVVRWHALHNESRRLIHHLERCHANDGHYPLDLSSYQPFDAGAFHRLQFWPNHPSGYVLSYHIGADITCHEYSPSNGWSYYPD